MLHQIWRFLTLVLLRPMYKWFLRKVTGKCELQRIVYGTEPGARRTLQIERSLKHSKHATLKRLMVCDVTDDLDLDQTVKEILKVKNVLEGAHPLFGPALHVCLCQLCGYRRLLADVETERKIAYSAEDTEHEALLMELWSSLCPDTALEARVTKQWGDVGFQGEDPMTDFRGMGILGLRNLIFLVRKHTNLARQLLLHAQHPKYGYSFAIVGINITGLAYKLLKRGDLKTHLYNTVKSSPTLEDFHHIYCCLFYDFDKFWRQEEPADIMQFNVVKKKYETKIVSYLRGDKTASLSPLFPAPNEQS